MSGYAENAIRCPDRAEPANREDGKRQSDALAAIGWALLAITEQLQRVEAVELDAIRQEAADDAVSEELWGEDQ